MVTDTINKNRLISQMLLISGSRICIINENVDVNSEIPLQNEMENHPACLLTSRNPSENECFLECSFEDSRQKNVYILLHNLTTY